MNNPTITDHSSNDTNGNRGVEAFLYLFIFGGMFLALIGGAIGFHFLLKQNPTLFSDLGRALQESNNSKPTTNTYNVNEETVTNDRVVTQRDTQSDVYINNVYENDDMSKPQSVQPSPQQPYTPPAPVCYTYEVFSGELKSKRCYTTPDYNLIRDYYNKYQSADWSYDSANSSVKFLCDGSDFFEDACEDAKGRKDKATDEKEKYLKLGLAVIARGTPVN